MKNSSEKYWICIIGATNSGNLKGGSDSPMRNAVQKAFEETIGREDEICVSGWGSDKETADIVNAVWSMDKDDPLYEAIQCMLKGSGRLS